jgi:hypothetical protein
VRRRQRREKCELATTAAARVGAPAMAIFLLLLRGVRSLHRLALTGLLALSCATAPRRAESPPPRVKDSAPEKIAAQRAATPGLYLEQDADRWGIEAARERRRDAQQKASPAPGARRPPELDVKSGPEK